MAEIVVKQEPLDEPEYGDELTEVTPKVHCSNETSKQTKSKTVICEPDTNDENVMLVMTCDEIKDESMDPYGEEASISGKSDDGNDYDKTIIAFVDRRKKIYSILNRSVASNEQQVTCELCDKVLKNKISLYSHRLIHTGEKPFKCHICGRNFNHKSNLRVHIRLHTGLKPFECKLCQKRFTQKSHLEGHLQSHRAEKPCICSVCKGSFCSPSNLRKHMQRHMNLRSHACSKCGDQFFQKSALESHVFRHHLGGKSLGCGSCNKKFYDTNGLRVHINHFHEVPSLFCYICEETSTNWKEFLKHTKVHLSPLID